MPGPSGPSPRKIGLTLAALMAIVFIAIIWVSMKTIPNSQSTANNLFPTDPSDIPNLEDLEQGASMFVTIVDRDDPTRIAGTLEADQFEPIGGGQRRLVNPDAWIFMRDGRRVHITADDGLVMMPDPNQAPDSGTLEGNVTINAYDAPVNPTDPLAAAMGIKAADHELPSVTARFDKPVEFERRYQRLTSSGRFVIDAPALNFIGHNLTVMLNEVKGRIELIDIRRGEQLILRPSAQASANKDSGITRTRQRQAATIRTVSQSSSAQPIQAPSTKLSAKPAPTSKQTPYHIEFQDQVMVNLIGSGTLNAETLDVWANLVDGSLSPDAIKQLNFKSQSEPVTTTASETKIEAKTETQPTPPESSKPATQSASTKPTSTSPTTSGTSNTPPKPVAKDGEVLVTWSGPLVVKPIDDPSATALASEELALSFNSQDLVRFASADQAVTGSAKQLTYGATTASLELQGSETSPVQLAAQDAGTLYSTTLQANLDDGVISIPSPGRLESKPTLDQPPAQIDWSDNAQFTLVKTPLNELTGRLQAAEFTGQVIGTRQDAVLRANALDAVFESTGPVESSLRTIAFNQGTLNSDSGSLSARDMTVGFNPDPRNTSVNPSSLTADGEVLIISPEGRITSDQLNAILTQTPDGQTEVRTALAQGNAEYLGKEQTHAKGDRLNLNNPANTIHIIGAPSVPAIAGQAGSTIQGPDIKINTRSRSIIVQGPGTFDHDIVAQGAPTGGHLNVRWNESMRFDDALGAIKCEGQVVAISTPDAFTIDTVKADRLEIDLTPAPGTDVFDSPTKNAQGTQPQRELYQARAFGRAVPGSDDIPASVESRSFDPNNPEVAVGVMYLQGSQLIANNRTQTLRVPASGMMVLMDRSADQPGGQTPQTASVMPNTSGPGLTRMTWLGSMTLDRLSGSAQVVNEVNIRHKSLTTGRVSQLGCDQLTAEFTPLTTSQTIGTPSAAPITMHRANANGRVRFTDLNRTLLSDHAIYNAQEETLFAFADDKRLVTLRDSTEPTPVSARTILWDLKSDLIQIDAPSPIRAPARP